MIDKMNQNICFPSLHGGWISNKGSLPASSRESAESCPTELPAVVNHFLAQVLTTLSRMQHTSGRHCYSTYSWEVSQTQALPPQTCWLHRPYVPRLIITKKRSDSGLLKSAFGLPGWEDSEATTTIKIARKSFPFFSQACNNVTKADEISAWDKLFEVKYHSIS